MFIDVMLRRRPSLSEMVPTLNRGFVQAFAALPGFWAEGIPISAARFNPGTGESATLYLHKTLAAGLSGQVCYAARLAGYLDEDEASNDDFLMLRLTTEEIDYLTFCSRIFPRLIEIFQPYRAAIETDLDAVLADWEIVREQRRETGRNINGRDSVFRIWPVNFFDDILCRRSFGIGVEEVVRRASPECERAEVLQGGAFLLVAADLVTGDALDDLNTRVMARLTQS